MIEGYMLRRLTVAITSVLVFGSGCSRDETETHAKDEIAKLTLKLLDLEIKVRLIETQASLYETAWFDTTGGKGYQRVDANMGYFLVGLEKVEPYLDGQKITLSIGNPGNVTFHGFKIRASWSGRMPAANLSPEEKSKVWEAFRSNKEREKEIALVDSLRPGTWNRVQFIISPKKAEEFGMLGIGITTNEVSLPTVR